MSIHEQARAEAEKRYPLSRVDIEQAFGSDHFEQGYLAGHEAATRTRVVTVERLTDALYQATQDPNDIDVPDVAKRLHALLCDPEEDR